MLRTMNSIRYPERYCNTSCLSREPTESILKYEHRKQCQTGLQIGYLHNTSRTGMEGAVPRNLPLLP